VTSQSQNTKAWPLTQKWFAAGLGLVSLGLGCAFYASMRPAQFWISWAPRLPPLPLPTVIATSAPSFLHTVAFALMGSAMSQKPERSVIFWTAVSLAWEAMQGLWPVLGVCDPSDFVFALLGGILSWTIAHGQVQTKLPPLKTLCVKIPVTLAGAAALMATSPSRGPFNPVYIQPIYMSYEDLRIAFRVEPPKPIAEAGKILRHDKYLLINDINKGIHVFDNEDPTQPKAIAFLNIPGNIDIAAKDQVIYADSFTDLLTIEFIDGNFYLRHLEADVFPYNAYQIFLNKGAGRPPYGSFKEIDPKSGVVIGAKDS